MNTLAQYFTDEMLFDSISSYLTITDLLRLCQVCRFLRQAVQDKCKAIIKNHNLSLISTKTSIHQMRFYFDRCLTLYQKKEDIEEQKSLKSEKSQKEKDRLKEDKYTVQSQQSTQNKLITYSLALTLENPFKYKTITYFEVGVQYTVCLTINKQAYIFKTCTVINLKDQPLNKGKNPHLNYEKRTNVAQIKCKSEHVTYLTESGEVYQMFGEKNSEKLFQKEQALNWCNYIEIEEIEASFNYTIFKPKRNNVCYEEFLKHVYSYEIDLEKVKNSNQKNSSQKYSDDQNQSQKKTTLVLLNNISLKYYFIEFNQEQRITQIVVGNREAYFLNDNYQCFACYFQQQAGNPDNPMIENFNHQQNKIIKAKIFHHFIDKQIIKLASGYNFFLVLERKMHDVSKWTVEEVCKWVREIGFGQFAKIFSVQKVDGKKLMTIDKNYMHSSLGITKPNMQQKFIMLLGEVIQNKNKEDTLYGWGKNENGQLGSRNANFIKEPQKIKPPTCFKDSEYIDSIFCGWFETFIRTQKGRVYRTVNYEKRKKNNQTSKDQEDFDFKTSKQGGLGINKHLNQGKKGNVDYEEAYDSETEFENKKNTGKGQKNYNSKKKRKYTEDLLVKKDGHHKKFQEEQKWIECQIGKAFFVQGYKDVLFFIQCPSQKQFEPTKQKKLRTAKMVLNKIIWSLKAEEQELYKVGYMDKDMGLIETTILELKTFDYNENRIKYIKKSNQVVWDRENKIDHLG